MSSSDSSVGRQIVGQTFHDTEGRAFLVKEYNPGNNFGREIVGVLQEGSDYSTTAAIFKEVWIDRAPTVSYQQQELNRKKLGV